MADQEVDHALSGNGPTLAFYALRMVERMQWRKLRRNTIDLYERHIRLYVLPYAGHRMVASLRRSDSLAFLDYLLTRPTLRSPHSVNGVFQSWVNLMNFIVDENVSLPPNIVSRIKRAHVPEPVDVLLSPADVASIASAIRELQPCFEIAVWLGACAGLRTGEIFGLKWSHIDFQRNMLSVEEQFMKGTSGPLKTRSSYATLAVDTFLMERLKDHLRLPHSPPLEEVVDISVPQIFPPLEEHVISDKGGNPVPYGKFGHQWNKAVRNTGLPKGTTLLSLRRFYISTLGNSYRHDPKTVQLLARHARFSCTWDTYARPRRAATRPRVDDFTEAFRETF
ncbi:tyrosine-type recombinase/integrase [Streptomyces sp. NBC_01261]|uniref:tyrosine-type recombinase/integrase n=1 Tax=unclassified Streptomyces TaxID=2593676 RepID=UPI002E35FEF3|nr:tyrosine-type recombinase/integrase [Streptomyces sp. NBC_01261]